MKIYFNSKNHLIEQKFSRLLIVMIDADYFVEQFAAFDSEKIFILNFEFVLQRKKTNRKKNSQIKNNVNGI